jgi:hypothetical protein
MAFSGSSSFQPEAGEAHRSPSPMRKTAERRDPYSPDILGDAHVLEQHRRTVEAMELSCRQTGALCAEAEKARGYLEAQADSNR